MRGGFKQSKQLAEDVYFICLPLRVVYKRRSTYAKNMFEISKILITIDYFAIPCMKFTFANDLLTPRLMGV